MWKFTLGYNNHFFLLGYTYYIILYFVLLIIRIFLGGYFKGIVIGRLGT
jgi:hypothetical protein